MCSFIFQAHVFIAPPTHPQFIPLPVLYGLFLFMGIASLSGVQVSYMDICHSCYVTKNSSWESGAVCTSFLCPRPQFVDRFLLLFIPDKYKPDHEYVRHVPNRWIHAFTLTQVVCIVILAVVKETQASIVFPIAVGPLNCALTAVRALPLLATWYGNN